MKAILVIFLFAVSAISCFGDDNLYPFGFQNDDKRIDYTNDGQKPSSVAIELTGPFLFGTQIERVLYLHSTGAIAFKPDVVPSNLTGVCGSSRVAFRGLTPFFTMINYTKAGNIYYREEVNGSLMQRASHEIVSAYPVWEGLRIQRLFIATWVGVKPAPVHTCGNTFQVVLATDGVFTFAMYHYALMEWPGQHSICTGAPTARVGLDNGEGHNHELSMSCQANVTVVAASSNINVPGKFIFRIDNAGLNFLSWVYYFYQQAASVWLWASVFLSFVIGLLSGLCCTACFACCASKKSKPSTSSTASQRRRHQHNDTHHVDVHIHEPPTYSPYPDELMPPKY